MDDLFERFNRTKRDAQPLPVSARKALHLNVIGRRPPLIDIFDLLPEDEIEEKPLRVVERIEVLF